MAEGGAIYTLNNLSTNNLMTGELLHSVGLLLPALLTVQSTAWLTEAGRETALGSQNRVHVRVWLQNVRQISHFVLLV